MPTCWYHLDLSHLHVSGYFLRHFAVCKTDNISLPINFTLICCSVINNKVPQTCCRMNQALFSTKIGCTLHMRLLVDTKAILPGTPPLSKRSFILGY